MAEAPAREREFAFSKRDFEEIRKMIYDHAGITLSDAKEDMVYSRLARRLRATGIRSFSEYLKYLHQDKGGEWEAFVNSLTTNLTDFFREAHHFKILRDFLLTRKERPITIWCSASSTGEEPYSIAMTAVEALGGFNIPVKVLASDLDTNVLKKGRDGVYPVERLNKLSQAQQKAFFLKGTGDNAGMARVKPELRALVDFFQLNLLDRHYSVRGPLDAIFCRNVMIYFDKPTQYEILKRMKPLLKPDGLLFVGHSEALYHATDLFHLRGQTVYEHAERQPAPRPRPAATGSQGGSGR
jgi:chemotaxis protein methyltransferase CheR